MKHALNVAAAFAAGAIAMYYFDAALGRSRRATAPDEGTAGGSRFDRRDSREPQTDAQLRERVRSRLGHWVTHPRAIEVDAQDGVIRVSGQVLAKELDGLLSRLTGVPGVRKVHNALVALDDPSGFGEAPRPGPQSVAH